MIADAYVTVDPAIALTARLVLIGVFGFALFHKLRAPGAFVAALANYRLVPNALTSVAATIVITAELATVLALATGSLIGVAAAEALLAIYAAAMAVNIARGRRDIDCGCSGPGLRQSLSGWLVVRNVAIIAVTLPAFAGVTRRTLGIIDGFSIAAALAAFSLLYLSGNQLAAVAQRYARRV